MMNTTEHPSSDNLRQTVETFWETIPPYWHRVKAHIRQIAVDQFDISVEQFHILRLVRRGYDSVSLIAKARNISRPAVSQAVNALVDKGLLTRTTDPQDRRYIQLALTDDGAALLEAVFEDTKQWMIQTLTPLSDEELQILTRAMNSLKKAYVE
jgi:DNA-binding MarR family transcriptional regulator